MDGEGYLRRVIEDRLRELAGMSAEARELVVPLHVQELRGLAWGLVTAGVLDEERAGALLARLSTLFEQRGIVPDDPAVWTQRWATAEARFEGHDDPAEEWARALDDPPAPELVGVVAVGQELGTVGELTVTLLSVDRWTTGVDVHYTLTPPLRRALLDLPHLTWRAWADDGTRCQSGGGGFSGGEIFTGDQWLHPAPTPEATTLTVVVAERDAEVGRLDVPL